MLLQFRGYSTGYKIDRQKFIRFACEHTANQKLKNKLQDVSHIEKLLKEKKIWKSNLHQRHHVCDEEMWRWTYHWIHYTCNLITCLFIIMITENFVVKLNISNQSLSSDTSQDDEQSYLSVSLFHVVSAQMKGKKRITNAIACDVLRTEEMYT